MTQRNFKSNYLFLCNFITRRDNDELSLSCPLSSLSNMSTRPFLQIMFPDASGIRNMKFFIKTKIRNKEYIPTVLPTFPTKRRKRKNKTLGSFVPLSTYFHFYLFYIFCVRRKSHVRCLYCEKYSSMSCNF